MSQPERPRRIVFAPAPRPLDAKDELLVVTDTAWTGASDDASAGWRAIRDVVGRVLATLDPVATAADLLDEWVESVGATERLIVRDVSMWYLVRSRTREWLEERVIWAAVVRSLVDEYRPAALAYDAGLSPSLVEVIRLVADADGLAVEALQTATDSDATVPAAPTAAPTRAASSTSVSSGSVGGSAQFSRAITRVRRLLGRRLPRRSAPRGATPGDAAIATPARPSKATWETFVRGRVDRLGAESARRLLVVSHHVPQTVETPAGPRLMNVYLGPVADRLRGSRLEPIVLDMTARRTDEASVVRVTGPGTDRILPAEALLLDDVPVDGAALAAAASVARDLAALRAPVMTSGVDLGAALAREVGEGAGELLPGKLAAIDRIGRLLDRLPIAGILVADEYHRQDWMIAARERRLPIAAIQHGLIYPFHAGYGHRRRPSSLGLPDRTYVFGRWERDVLVEHSVYRADEVVVAGSPRLDAVTPGPASPVAVRGRLGIADGTRMVVLSGTHGSLMRTFHYPVALAKVFDRQLKDVHVVVKLHPAEDDQPPYRAVIEGVARASGFDPPPITVVRDVDLYQLLAAADVHLGIHSTVLTEAVLVGTPNLLAAVTPGGDLLGYVEAGVAIPVTDGGQLLDGLEAAAAGAITPVAQNAFTRAHFEPGSASLRIAEDLLRWLP